MAGLNFDLYGGGAMGGYQAAQDRDRQNMLAQQQMQQVTRQNQLGEMQLAAAQRDQDAETRLNQLYAAGEDRTSPEFIQKVYGISVPKGMAYEKALSERQKAMTENETARVNLIDSKLKQRQAVLEKYVRTPEDYINWHLGTHEDKELNAFLNSMGITADTSRAKINESLSTPGGFEKLLLESQLGLAKVAEINKPKFEQQNLGGKVRTLQIPAQGGAATVVPGSEANISMTPYQTQSLEMDKKKLAQAQQRLAQETATGNLTPQTLDFAAQMYTQTGQMPPMGMGKSAANLRAQILTRAAEIKMGGGASAEEAAGGVVANKMDVKSKTKAVTDFSTGVQGKQVNAFNTAIDHLDTMDKLSDALINGDIKAFNAVGNMVSKQTGAPAPTNFNAAKQIVTSEIIKAVVASGGGVTERQEAEANFAAANSPTQLKGLIGTYKKLLGGQLNSLNLQYENTTGRKDFDKKLTPAAKAEVAALKPTLASKNAKGWTLHTDANGNKAYVSPDGKSYEEAK